MADLECESNQKSQEAEKGTKKSRHRLLGALSSICAGLGFSAAAILSKRLNYIPSSQLTMHFCAGMIFYNLPVMIYKRIPPFYTGTANIHLLLRALFITAAYNFIYLALIYIPVADMTVIGCCSPILTAILARIFLREPCSAILGICLVFTLGGILLVSKIPVAFMTRTVEYNLSYIWGFLLAFSGSVSFACSNMFVRTECMKAVHHSVMVLYIGVASVVVNWFVTYFTVGFHLPICGFHRMYLLLHVIAGSSVESLVTIGLQFEEASTVIILLNATNIAVSFLWQTMADGIVPDAYTITGATIVLSCIIIISTKKKIISYFSLLKKQYDIFIQ